MRRRSAHARVGERCLAETCARVRAHKRTHTHTQEAPIRFRPKRQSHGHPKSAGSDRIRSERKRRTLSSHSRCISRGPSSLYVEAPGADVGRVPAQTSESRRRCGRSPGCGRASPGADQHCPVPAKMWASPGADAGGAGHWAVWNPEHTSVYPPPKPMGVWLCARACMLVCARALVRLIFYPDIELASLLPLCERDTHGNGGSRVSGSAHVRARAQATARACVRACVRACTSSNDGRGVGRSRTARFARVPRYSLARALQHVRS